MSAAQSSPAPDRLASAAIVVSGEQVGSVLIDSASIAVIAFAAVLCVLNVPQTPRVLVLFLATVLGPGGALLTLIRADNHAAALALAASLSLSIELAGSLIMAWAQWWHPIGFAVGLGAVSVALLVADVARRVGSPEAAA